MAYIPTGKRVGRPKKHVNPQQTLGVRIDKSLYDDVARKAAEQDVTIQNIVVAALYQCLKAPCAPAIQEGLLIAGDAFTTLEEHCQACPRCRVHVDATLSAAWPKFLAAIDASAALEGGKA